MDDYQACLAAGGAQIIETDGACWQNYKGVLVPAYLPHAVPAGISSTASDALKASGALLARWTEDFGKPSDSEWWFVQREGPYASQDLSSSTRSKLNRGKRRLEARPVSPDELLRKGYDVCRAAVDRYGQDEFLPPQKAFIARLKAAELHPSSMEYHGVFRGEELVAFSENHVQDRAVFLESIWYEPTALKDYSSYVLVDAILGEYLGRREFRYVSDGSRSIYHETGVHDFLIEKFGFRRVRVTMHLLYSPLFAFGMGLSRPLKGLLANGRARTGVMRKLAALHFQESIATSIR